MTSSPLCRIACTSDPPIRPRPSTATRPNVAVMQTTLAPRLPPHRWTCQDRDQVASVARGQPEVSQGPATTEGGVMTQRGFAIAAFRDAGQWRCEPLPPAVLDDLRALVAALRGQPPEGGPFVIASVDEEFFLVARQDGARISLLLSDLTA